MLIFNKIHPESSSDSCDSLLHLKTVDLSKLFGSRFYKMALSRSTYVVEMVTWVSFSHSFLQPSSSVRECVHVYSLSVNFYDIHGKRVLSSSLLNPDFTHKAALMHHQCSVALGFFFVCSEAMERSPY